MKRKQAVHAAADKTRDAAQRAGMTAQHAAERAGLAAQQAAERAGLAAQHAGPLLEKAKDQATTMLEKGRDNAVPLLEKAKDNAGPLLAKAREEAMDLYERAASEMGPAVTEGKRRAKLAAKAARGEKPPRRWPWIAGALAFGGAVGAAVVSVLRKRPQTELHTVDAVDPDTMQPKTTGPAPEPPMSGTTPDTGVQSDNGRTHAHRDH
jgi:hypothetical protein